MRVMVGSRYRFDSHWAFIIWFRYLVVLVYRFMIKGGLVFLRDSQVCVLVRS